MERAKLKAIVNRHSIPLRDFLGLSDWGIAFKYEHLEDSAAQCWPKIDYMTATITFDADKFGDSPQDEEEVFRLLFHEYCHLFTAYFDIFGESIQKAMQNENVNLMKGLYRSYYHASERTVIYLEWIWRFHLRTVYLKFLEDKENASTDSPKGKGRKA